MSGPSCLSLSLRGPFTDYLCSFGGPVSAGTGVWNALRGTQEKLSALVRRPCLQWGNSVWVVLQLLSPLTDLGQAVARFCLFPKT